MLVASAEYGNVKRLFLQAVQREPSARRAILEESGASAAVLAEVESLLLAHGDERLRLEDEGPPLETFSVPGYRLLQALGEGGAGLVFEAERDPTGERVAVKVLRPDHVGARASQRFDREARLLRELDHPGIVGLLDHGEAVTPMGSRPFLVVELVDGIPITDWAVLHGLDERGCIELMLQVCDAMSSAHALGVVHRDLKPSNVLVTAGGAPRILDFGIGKKIAASATRLTYTGEMIGTLAYASPEQIAGRPVDARADLHALAAMLMELVAGRPPHEVAGLPVIEAQAVCAVAAGSSAKTNETASFFMTIPRSPVMSAV